MMAEIRTNDKNPYAGRWIARVRGKIIAQGGSPKEARLAAKSVRNKDELEILFMPLSELLTFPLVLDSIQNTLKNESQIYLVGGVIRDAILGRTTRDIDIVMQSDGIKTARYVANKLKADFYPLDSARDTGRVITTDTDGTRTVIDFAVFRGKDLESDLRNRDFSVNSIAMDLHTREIYDPLGGILDLQEKRLRVCSETTFSDDPIRILRALRFAADFGFHILPETRKDINASVKLLVKISAERIRDELFRILEGKQPAICLQALDVVGGLKVVLPELASLKYLEQPPPHIYDAWKHTLKTVEQLTNIYSKLVVESNPNTTSDLLDSLLELKLGHFRHHINKHLSKYLNVNRSLKGLLIFAALYHDIAKPLTRTVSEDSRIRFGGHDARGAEIATTRARSLQLSNDEIERLQTIILNHMRIHFHTNRIIMEGKFPSRRAIYRFFRDAGEAGVDICLLAMADFRATYGPALPQDIWAACLDVVQMLFENYWEKSTETISPVPLVNGEDLMRMLNLQPGPLIGELLGVIRESQAVGKVKTKKGVLTYARDYLSKRAQGEIGEVVKINDVRLTYFQRPGIGLPIVMLHGFPLDHSIWQPIIPYLNPETRLILPDLRGHGKSDAPAGDYSMDKMADDIVGLLDYLRIRKAILVGHSMGGYVALAFARFNLDRLLGLVLVASRTDADSNERRNARFKTIEEITSKGMAPIAVSMLPKLTNDTNLHNRLYEIMIKTKPIGAMGTLKGMAERADSTVLLASLNVPQLAIVGGMDNLISTEQIHSISKITPRLKLVKIPKAGHMPMMEYPQETAAAINLIVDEINDTMREN